MGLVGCARSDETPASDQEVKAASPEAIAELFGLVDDNCAGNDNGSMTMFDPSKFDPGAIMEELKREDRDASGVDCSDQRVYSTSKASGVEMFEQHLTAKTDEFRESDQICLEENLSGAQRKQLLALVADPDNLGVFVGAWDGKGDNSEACAYCNFHVYRKDGALIRFTFNHTD